MKFMQFAQGTVDIANLFWIQVDNRGSLKLHIQAVYL